MKPIAIIGLAAKFAHFNNIDRIDRALYIGERIAPSNLWQSDECLLHADKLDPTLSPLSRQVEDVLFELCEQAQQSKSEITVFVICSDYGQNRKNNDNTSTSTSSSNIEKHIELLGQNWHLFSFLNDAMDAAQPLLASGRTCALIGVEQVDESDEIDVNHDGSINAVQTNETIDSLGTISFDKGFRGYTKGNGISGVMLEESLKSRNEGRYIYAQVKAFHKENSLEQVLDKVFHSKESGLTNKETYQSTSQDTYENTNESQNKNRQGNSLNFASLVSQVGLLEVSSSNDVALASGESQALTAKFCRSKKLNTAISCVKSMVGDCGGFGEVLSLISLSLAVQQRYIPSISGWNAPKEAELSQWQDSNFYIANHAKIWFREKITSEKPSARLAGYSCLTRESAGLFLIEESDNVTLEQSEKTKAPTESYRNNGFLCQSDFHLFILSGSEQAALENSVAGLRKQLKALSNKALNAFTEHNILGDIANRLYAAYQDNVKQQGESKRFTFVLIADSLDLLTKELDRFEQSAAKVFTDKISWKTPNGSYFTYNPLNDKTDETPDAGLAFLYPGIGATYVGLGCDLLRLFPDVFPTMTALSPNIQNNLKDRFLNPRSIKQLSFKELKSLDSDLRNSLVDIAEAGVAYACLYSQIFESSFMLKANFAAGYSMGEVSMYAALGCWQDPELMSERLASSPIFTQELAGELKSAPQSISAEYVDKYLDKYLDKYVENIEKAPLWETYSVKANVHDVAPYVGPNTGVYCTIVNTEDNLLLAGPPKECKGVIKQLNTKAMPLNMPNIIHCELAQGQYNEMLNLYHLPMAEKIATKLYSSSCYLPIPQHSKAIAVSIAKCLCQVVDFPKLINRMHDDGARIFVEMGAGRSLSGWVDKIIANKLGTEQEEHLSLPINAKGTKDEITFFRAVAKLVSHGVNINLSRFFEGSLIVNKQASVSNFAGRSEVVEFTDNPEYITNAGAKAFANTNNH